MVLGREELKSLILSVVRLTVSKALVCVCVIFFYDDKDMGTHIT